MGGWNNEIPHRVSQTLATPLFRLLQHKKYICWYMKCALFPRYASISSYFWFIQICIVSLPFVNYCFAHSIILFQIMLFFPFRFNHFQNFVSNRFHFFFCSAMFRRNDLMWCLFYWFRQHISVFSSCLYDFYDNVL